MPHRDLRLIIQAALALAHLFLPLLLLFRRRGRRRDYVPLVLYCVLSAVWGLGVALAAQGSNQVSWQLVYIADYVRTDLPVLLAALLVSIGCKSLDRRDHWAWGTAGITWSVVTFGSHLLTRSDAAAARSVTMIAQVGWLVFSCLVIILSARWTLRAPLAFYRNRGIYWLGLLGPLLAGQALALVQDRWGEIVLVPHFLGTTGVTICALANYLPNIKSFLRSVASNMVLAVATALLYALGLVIIQPLFWMGAGLHVPVIGATVVAIVLGLIHHPFHRLIGRIVNRLLWGKGYDPAWIVRDYGRIIGNVLDLEQLATVVVGTISEVLEIQRGALLVITKTEGPVTLRVIEGMGQITRREITLAPASPILLHLTMRGEHFFQYDLDYHRDLQEASYSEKEELRSLDMEIYLPILARERLLGVLVLGPHGKGEPYGSQEVALLATLAQQTAVALQNAYLFGNLRALNAEITQLNEDLRTAYERLKKLDQAKTDFLSIASHELRTPLTVIQGYTDVLTEIAADHSLTPEHAIGITTNLKAGVERLAAVVTAIIDASEIEVKAIDIHRASTTLSAVMATAVGPWREAFEKRHISLTPQGIDDIPPIEADFQRLSQAFGNIISNAIKYTPDGGQVSIEASMVDQEHFEVVIADTGVGIAPEDQPLIFEKFYRVGDLLLHSTGDAKFKGAGPGLGLHIAQGVIEAHGGRIWVESEGYDEERCPGSAFHVLLPLRAGSPVSERRQSDEDKADQRE